MGMKNYLSMGFGWNSVALYLLMQDMGMEFEAVFVDHGGDWPETYEYADYFISTGRPVTILKPSVQGSKTLLGHCKKQMMIPSRLHRWCTDKFKIRVMAKYYEKPAFVHLGIDAGESHRAKMSGIANQENRYILVEEGIDRAGCGQIIKDHGLPLPIKSGCWFCPFQKKKDWQKLRRTHPCLFEEAVKLEAEQNIDRLSRGKQMIFLYSRPLPDLINDQQIVLPGMESLEYPPCQCGL